ncbi:MAG TPA: RDD family protein [Thermoanaerobaculia bacterium]|nr:RDD family protein [Thermoanaerobaculia bacterium]
MATAAAISPRLAPPAPSAPGTTPEQAGRAERELWTDRGAGADRADLYAGDAVDAAAAPIPSDRVGIGRRAASGAADLLVHVAVAILALAGCRTLGVMPAVADWPAFGVFLLSFSFLYTVVPLAFWGHTLGMTWAGLTAESTGGEPLSFDQTARRWLGALLTLATAGLPLLLALRGRSLADRLSGSRTLAN